MHIKYLTKVLEWKGRRFILIRKDHGHKSLRSHSFGEISLLQLEGLIKRSLAQKELS